MKIGDTIKLKHARKCTTFKLRQFSKYECQDRNNFIFTGVIIDAIPFILGSGMHTLLIKDINSDSVCAYRTYDNEFKIDK